MEHLEIILPIILLALAFVLKLSIDRDIEVPNLIQALCELPVDAIFLAISFSGACAISNPKNVNQILIYTTGFIVVAVVVVIIWRKSLRYFENNKTWKWISLLCINMVISILVVYLSIDILLNKEGNVKKTELKVKNNGN